MESGAQWFWLILTLACLAWYSTVTIYVAIKGAFDIRNLFGRLKKFDRKKQTTHE